MIKFKATEGNIEKLNLIKSEFPNQDTITSSELKSIPALLSPSAKKPVLISSGMSTWNELEEAVKTIKNVHNDITVSLERAP